MMLIMLINDVFGWIVMLLCEVNDIVVFDLVVFSMWVLISVSGLFLVVKGL